MKTPAGTECRYYYEDFNRGREIRECRLIQSNPSSKPWHPSLCRTCPVPAILRANGCPNMVFRAKVGYRWLLLKQVTLDVFCTFSGQPVADPMIGCGRCHDDGWDVIRESFYAQSEGD